MARRNAFNVEDKFNHMFHFRLMACRTEEDINRLHSAVIKNISVPVRCPYIKEIDNKHTDIIMLHDAVPAQTSAVKYK
ncbi:hypothetical protein [Enterobacter roggenkampii]|uniref:hypothetical protein n=1 Tax=Enterobacter roggenkampii TaxID=1812935 RepID=UPI002A807AE2|nr:hypothetical protein [Enterobacter roggenkampii]